MCVSRARLKSRRAIVNQLRDHIFPARHSRLHFIFQFRRNIFWLQRWLRFIVNAGVRYLPPPDTGNPLWSSPEGDRSMWMLIASGMIVMLLIAVLVSAWWSVFRDARAHEPLCPHCRGPMTFAPSMIDARFLFQCKRCKGSDPLACPKAESWTRSKLRAPD
jgi:hypothetical protein